MDEKLMNTFYTALGSTWFNGLLVNESKNATRPQPTEFGIQWYVSLRRMKLFLPRARC